MDRVEGIVTTASGRRVGYLDRGPRAGRSVVYFHGMPGSRREQLLFHDDVLEMFGLRVISFDRAGWGDSDPLDGDRVERSRDAVAVCDALGVEEFSVLAVSSGGSFAVTLAATAPERVTRLVLAAAQMPYDDDRALARLLPDQRRLLEGLRGGPNGQLEAGVAAYRDQVLADPMGVIDSGSGGFSPAELALLNTDAIRQLFTDDITLGLARGHAGLLHDLLLWPRPFEVDVTSIRCRVHAIHGTEDEWEPIANLRRVLHALPDARIVGIEGQNHFAPLVTPITTMSLLI